MKLGSAAGALPVVGFRKSSTGSCIVYTLGWKGLPCHILEVYVIIRYKASRGLSLP